MILREVPEGLLCIQQLDHSLLAGRLAARWGSPAVPPLEPRELVLEAIGRHDAGWPDLDREPVWNPETGRPHTFRTHALPDQLGVAERSVERVAAVDPYAGWLVSRHFVSFHEQSDDPAARAWVAAQVEKRVELHRRAAARLPDFALDPCVLEANFDWLQLLDALSLALCHDWDAWTSRLMARDYAGTRGRYRYARRGSMKTLSTAGRVDPWPFADSRVAETVPAHLLEGRRWKDPESLRTAWHSASIVTVEAALTAA